MTRIGLISDTHGSLPDGFHEFTKDCNQIWHAGDIGNIKIAQEIGKEKSIVAVYGNIDGQDIRTSNCPKEQLFICEKMRVYMTHIAGYPGKYLPSVRKRILALRHDIVVAGHSHILKIIYDKKLKHLHLNPGAAGRYGVHKHITMLRFEINQDRVENMEIYEKPKQILAIKK
jgi:putative phosphoesterase